MTYNRKELCCPRAWTCSCVRRVPVVGVEMCTGILCGSSHLLLLNLPEPVRRGRLMGALCRYLLQMGLVRLGFC